MSTAPLLTFKAGQCELQTSSRPYKVTCKPEPGYIFVWSEDDMLHFAWRKRSTPASTPEIDLIVFPDDASFVPYTGKEPAASSDNVESPTNGRIYVLRFQSSSQRYLFWLQSKSQHPEGKDNWFSPRDLKLGQIVDRLMHGEEDINVAEELREVSGGSGPGRRDDDPDEPMEDVEGAEHDRDHNRSNSTGGAGAGATGGDIREEGAESREGGADGGRAAAGAPSEASAIVQSFLNSLQGRDLSGAGASGRQQQSEKIFTTLGDLFPSAVTIPVIESAPASLIDTLTSHLPPTILLLAQEVDDLAGVDPNSETVQAAVQALSMNQKKDILRRVLRSPQMHQGLESMTGAIREGGLPMVSEALKIKVENGGLIPGGAMPLGGGDAVEAFVEGVRRTVKEDEGRMDTS